MNKKEKTQAIVDYLSLPYHYDETANGFIHDHREGVYFDIYNPNTALNVADFLNMDISISARENTVRVLSENSSHESGLRPYGASEVLPLAIAECAMMEIEYQNSLKRGLKP